MELEKTVKLSSITNNPLTPKSDQHLISPYNISPESHTKVMRITEMIKNNRSFGSLANSPCQHLRKCIENSMENMHTDVRV